MKTLKSILLGLTTILVVAAVMTSCEQDPIRDLAEGVSDENSDLNLATGHTCSGCTMPFADQQPDEIIDVLITYNQNGEPVTQKAARYGNTVVYGGDIVLTENYSDEISLRGNIVSDFSTKWPSSTMPYVWGTGLTQTKKNQILNAIADINAKTNLCVVERTNEVHYVQFRGGPGGCYANSVGNSKTANQTINLDSGCFTKRTIIHEILHKAGFFHEQTRHDRDNYITVNWDNLDTNWEYQFMPYGGETSSGNYDFTSIMHYSQYHPDVTIDDSEPMFFIDNINSLPAGMTADQIGNLPEMSTTDIAAVNAAYPNPCSGGDSGSTRHEAENAVLTGVSTDTSVSGFSGTGHMLGSTFKDNGDKIKFTINAPSAGSYPLKIRYYNHGNSNKYQNISINGGNNQYTLFPAAATWATLDLGNVSLNAGNNSIEIKKSWGWTSIDYIDVDTGDSSSSIQKIEAENATLTGVSTGSSVSGFSGMGHTLASTLNTSSDRIRFTVSVPTSGNYPLKIRYYNQGGVNKYQNISINSGGSQYTQFPASSSWATLNYGNVYLNSGNNTIDIKKSWGWTNIDYIQVGS